MENIKINNLARDFICLQAGVFRHNPHLAWQARSLFINTPGIVSFEVSPQTGEVFIGIDQNVLAHDDINQAALALLGDFFPDLVVSPRFQGLYRTVH